MRLNTQGSSFIFNLPSDVLPNELMERYQKMLDKNWVQYENVIDYLNSTIKEVSFPGMSIPTPSQTLHYGKQRDYKPVTNINDILSNRELSIVFRRVDSDLNYWIMYNLIAHHYLDITSNQKIFANPFTITALDIHRDAIYEIQFKEIIFNSLSEIIFAYNQQQFDEQTFTLNIRFNFIHVEYILDGSKLLEINDIGEASIINR